MGVDDPGIPVVAAVIRRDERLLLACRPRTKRHGGLWEFPGGKVGDRESPAQALARELHEELGVTMGSSGPPVLSVRDPGSRFEIHFCEVEIAGEPRALEHEELRWVTAAEARELDLAPSDRRFLEWIGS